MRSRKHQVFWAPNQDTTRRADTHLLFHGRLVACCPCLDRRHGRGSGQAGCRRATASGVLCPGGKPRQADAVLLLTRLSRSAPLILPRLPSNPTCMATSTIRTSRTSTTIRTSRTSTMIRMNTTSRTSTMSTSCLCSLTTHASRTSMMCTISRQQPAAPALHLQPSNRHHHQQQQQFHQQMSCLQPSPAVYQVEAVLWTCCCAILAMSWQTA
ncbi:hypothetical protein BC831DRAFT_454333 [Entophlyctis helioformis]|nr:hypothetical protein BC831DRAFT_454333 [Entophlyctis helioformis]